MPKLRAKPSDAVLPKSAAERPINHELVAAAQRKALPDIFGPPFCTGWLSPTPNNQLSEFLVLLQSKKIRNVTARFLGMDRLAQN